MRLGLERKVQDAQDLNDHMRSELDRVHDEKERSERDMRTQLETISARASGDNEWKKRYEGLERTHQDLRAQLAKQERITTEVRSEAGGLLNQLRDLAHRTNENTEREEDLIRKAHQLENEVRDWKNRYAKAQTKSRNARSASVTIQQVDFQQLAREGLLSAPNGLVKDVDVTNFQVSINELLRSARSDEPKAVLSQVKNVAISVRSINMSIGNDKSMSQADQSEKLLILQKKVAATANNLITASKNFAFSDGLTPVSLLDAAASHLSAAVVEFLRIAKVRISSDEDLDRDDDDNSIIADSPADYYGFSNTRSSAGGDSTYSPPSPQRGVGAVSNGMGGKRNMPNGVANGAPHGLRSTPGAYSRPGDAKTEELKVSPS